MKAAIINATNASLSAVQAAVNSANPGDTVNVPAGTNTWTSSLTVNTDIQLIGAGSNRTVIVDGGSTALTLIGWTTSSNYFDRLSGFTFSGTDNTGSQNGSVHIMGSSQAFRIDHCSFLYLDNACVLVGGSVAGVVDHCTFLQGGDTQNAIRDYPGNMFGNSEGYGDGSWANPVQYGNTNNWLYVEACVFTFTNYPYAAVNDSGYGGRIVFRYNLCTNCFFQGHGTETSQRYRGARAFEVYDNTFVDTVAGYNAGTAIYDRSGSGVFFSNTITGYGSMIVLGDFRATDNFFPWGSSNGQNLWDSNDLVAVASGNFTGTSGLWYMIDSNANWTTNQFVGSIGSNTNCAYEIQDVTQGGTNSATFGLIMTNSSDIVYSGCGHTGSSISWNNGDAYKIYRVYYTLDQIGLGSGDLVEDSSPGSGLPVNSVTGQPTWPHEVSEPLYQWGNTFNGTPNASIGIQVNAVSGECEGGAPDDIIINRDYFDNMVKPGYTPLPYPYPLDTANTASSLPTFTLTVADGAGSGAYTNSAIVNIVANEGNTVSNGTFGFWSGSDVANTNAASTTVTMPASNLTVTANYDPTPPPGILATNAAP